MLKNLCTVVVLVVAIAVGIRALGGDPNPKKLLQRFESQVARDIQTASDNYEAFKADAAELTRRAKCYEIQIEKIDDLLAENKTKDADLQEKLNYIADRLKKQESILDVSGQAMATSDVETVIDTLNVQRESIQEMLATLTSERKELSTLAKQTVEDSKKAPILLEGLRISLENLRTRANLQRERLSLGLANGDMKSSRKLYQDCLNSIKVAKASFGDQVELISKDVDWDSMRKSDPASAEQTTQRLIDKCNGVAASQGGEKDVANNVAF